MHPMIAVGTDHGSMVFKPGPKPGSGWVLACQGQNGREVEALAQAPDGHLYVGAAPGTVYRTLDGETWQTFAEGLTLRHVRSLSLHPQAPQVLFAGTQPAGVFRSFDGGSTWTRLLSLNQAPGGARWSYPEPPNQALVTSLVQHPLDPRVVLASLAIGGLYASLDGGETWVERHAGLHREVYQVVIHPKAPGTLFAATGGGIYRSDDLGERWREMNGGLPYQFVRSLAVHPDHPEVLMTGVDQHRRGGLGLLARSRDGGARWEVVSEGLPSMADQRITAVTAAGGGLAAFGTDKGLLFVTEDFGETWRRMRMTCPPVRAMITLRHPLQPAGASGR